MAIEKTKKNKGRDEKGRFLEGHKISEGNNGGRPSEYDEEKYCSLVKDYLKEARDKIGQFHKTRGDKSNTFQRYIKVDLPTIEKFSKFVNIPLRTIYEWSDKYPKFSQALEEIKEEQKNRLLDKGLSGDYNPLITKLILSANHNMTEKIEHSGEIKKVEVIEIVNPYEDNNKTN
jgi:hypothetical protein